MIHSVCITVVNSIYDVCITESLVNMIHSVRSYDEHTQKVVRTDVVEACVSL